MALVGWQHKLGSPPQETTVAIFIGAISIVANENDVGSSTKTPKHPREITSAIEYLSSQFPCTSTKPSCGQCTNCATYQSLQILDIIDANQDTRTDSGRKESKQQQHQLILYNPNESNDWYARQTGKHAQYQQSEYSPGSWETILLQVSASLNVRQNLNRVMESNEQNLQLPAADKRLRPKTDSCDSCSCKSEESKKEQQFGTWNKSLPLLYWRMAHINHNQLCQQCGRTKKDLPRLSSKVPLVSLLKITFSQKETPTFQLASNTKNLRYSTATFAALFLDVALGLIVGLLFLTRHASIIRITTYIWQQYQHAWEYSLVWLNSNPGGVKMNESLTQQIGIGVEWVLIYHKAVISYIFPSDNSSVTLQIVGALSIIFGSRFFFALAFDASRLAFLHIRILSSLFSACQRIELSTLSSLWLLFRGKKRNILRLRSDHLHYDHMQLLLGMLLFSVCIFLFTTILVHHWYFAAVGILSEFLSFALWLGYMGVESVFHIDRVISDGQMTCGKGDQLWTGMDVTFLPVPLKYGRTMRKNDNAYIEAYFNGSNPYEVKEEMHDVAELAPGVSVHSGPAVVSKLTFPVTSNPSIVVKALVSSIASMLAKAAAFLPRALFGASPCRIGSSCKDVTNALHQS